MPANRVYAELRCPRCSCTNVVEIEAEIDGRGFDKDYKVGDRIEWLPGQHSLINQDAVSGYVVCEVCGLDYFVKVILEDDVLCRIEVDHAKPGYM